MAGVSNAYTGAAELVRLVRNFSQRTPEWAEAIRYNTLPDERLDLTLVSQRVYGNRNEFLTIMAAAGLSGVYEPLTERLLVLPTPRQLDAIKALAGFQNSPALRDRQEAANPLTAR